MMMLLVTHELGFARGTDDRICFFHEGCILEEGTPGQIFDDPKTDECRKFISALLE